MVRFGMCGCGGFIEKGVLPSLRNIENGEAVAAFDVDPARVERVCALYNIPHRCGTYEELLATKGVDAVYIASPNVLHKEQTVAAATAGKHVFCQKPLAINAAECRAMLAACKERGVRLGVGFCNRFGGATQKAKQLIAEGAIGEVSQIHFAFSLGGYNKDTAGWRCDPKMSGGGPLMDLTPHMVDLACFLLEDKVESVMAYVRPPLSDTDIEIDVLAILQFTRGARMSMDTSFVRVHSPSFALVGNKGLIRATGTVPWRTGGKMHGWLVLEREGKEERVDFSVHEHIDQEMALFCEAIEKGEEVPVPGETGLHAQAVIDAIYESGLMGKLCVVED